jgi:hypothetical protein
VYLDLGAEREPGSEAAIRFVEGVEALGCLFESSLPVERDREAP